MILTSRAPVIIAESYTNSKSSSTEFRRLKDQHEKAHYQCSELFHADPLISSGLLRAYPLYNAFTDHYYCRMYST